MKLNDIFMAAVIAFSVFGCSDEAEPPSTAPEMCEELGVECTGNTICGETDCEVALPREYRAHLHLYSPTPPRKCEIPLDCPRGSVRVYHGDNAEPILDSREPSVAYVELDVDSSLVIEINGASCTIPMTAELLRRASPSCTKGGVRASVSLFPMPLDADVGEER